MCVNKNYMYSYIGTCKNTYVCLSQFNVQIYISIQSYKTFHQQKYVYYFHFHILNACINMEFKICVHIHIHTYKILIIGMAIQINA